MRYVQLICAVLAIPALGQPLEVRGQDAAITDSAGVRIVTSPASDAIIRAPGRRALLVHSVSWITQCNPPPLLRVNAVRCSSVEQMPLSSECLHRPSPF